MKRKPREYIGVTFKCCRIYSRILINKDGTAYAGLCPKCGAKIEVQIASTGPNAKYFRAE